MYGKSSNGLTAKNVGRFIEWLLKRMVHDMSELRKFGEGNAWGLPRWMNSRIWQDTTIVGLEPSCLPKFQLNGWNIGCICGGGGEDEKIKNWWLKWTDVAYTSSTLRNINTNSFEQTWHSTTPQYNSPLPLLPFSNPFHTPLHRKKNQCLRWWKY